MTVIQKRKVRRIDEMVPEGTLPSQVLGVTQKKETGRRNGLRNCGRADPEVGNNWTVKEK